MPYHWDPDAAGILPEGVNILTVVAIEDSTSSKGDPMWVVRLEDDRRREVTEWIVQTPRIVEWKFKPLWEAAGLEWPRGAAILDEQQLVDRRVQATIAHEETPAFGRQPRIQGYARLGASDLPGQESFDTTNFQPAAVASSRPADDDDIPF